MIDMTKKLTLKRTISLVATVLIIMLCMGSVCAYAAEGAEALQAERSLCGIAGCSEGSLLACEGWTEPGSSGSDWLAYVFALNKVPEKYEEYLAGLEEYVTNSYAEQGCLHRVLATDYHRTALLVEVLGGDPRAFGKDQDGQPVDLIAEGTWNFEAGVDKQGLNGLVFALIALDSQGYDIPEGTDFSREWILSRICDEQNDDGGFGLVPGSSDIDMTAMTLAALAPYKDSSADVIDAALTYLSEMQKTDGSYESFGDVNPESISQVIIALSSLGIDPDTDERFIKDGHKLTEALDQFRLEEGTYSHLKGEDWDLLATEQALLALTAIDRSKSGQPGIYDFTDYEFSPSEINNKESNNFVWIIAALAVIAAIAAVAMIRRRRCRK